jgi:hypothetical protein
MKVRTAMLPTPKECTACGSTRSTNDDPLVVYAWRRTDQCVGWVHKGCRGLLFAGMRGLDDDMRDRMGLDIPERDPNELWEFLTPQ